MLNYAKSKSIQKNNVNKNFNQLKICLFKFTNKSK